MSIIFYLLYIPIAFDAIYVTPSVNLLRASQFFTLLLILLILFNRKKIKLYNSYCSTYVYLLVVSLLVSTLFSIEMEIAFISTAKIIFYYILSIVIFLFMKESWKIEIQKVENLFPIIYVLSLIISLNIIYEFITATEVTRFSGIKGEPNSPSGTLNIILPILFYGLHKFGVIKKSRFKNLFAFFLILSFILINILSIILSGSRMGLLILSIILLFLLIKTFKIYLKPLKAMIIILTLFLVINWVKSSDMFEKTYDYIFSRTFSAINFLITRNEIAGSSLTSRANYVVIGLDLFWKYPIFGTGLYSEYYILRSLTGDGWYHNSFLEILAGGGIVSFIFYLLIHIRIFQQLKYLSKYNSSGFFLMISFFALILNNIFLSNTSEPFFWTLFLPFSMYMEWWRKNKLAKVHAQIKIESELSLSDN